MESRRPPAAGLVERLRRGDRSAAARLISMVENGEEGAEEAMREVHRLSKGVHVIGITGAPGVGKSTLLEKLALETRKAGKRVGVIAVDPTSPFTGGAVLGDRVRMGALAGDPGVFIRSMGTRGHFGGLSRATGRAVRVLDALGMDTVFLETVGVGQSEVEVIRAAHTVAVVLVPGLGDEVQALKAGLLEIADIYVINKADRDGVERLEQELNLLLDLAPDAGKKEAWRPPVVRTVATDGEGVRSLLDAVGRHRAFLRDSGRLERMDRDRAREEVLAALQEKAAMRVLKSLGGRFDDTVERVVRRELDPAGAAEELMVGASRKRAGRRRRPTKV